MVDTIVRSADLQPGDKVLEIGPGIGTLTQALALAGADVTAVELDAKLLPVLEKTLVGAGKVKVVHGDILEQDIGELMGGEKFKVVANLPYYITTPIIMKLLESDLPIERLVTMVQKEVAERMVAAPGGKDYGALSIGVQVRCEVHIPAIVPAQSFIPEPKVDSAVVVCRLRTEPAVDITNEKLFFRIVRAAFSQRRKMLANCLKTMGLSTEQVQVWLNRANIDGKRRAETLSLAEYAELQRMFAE